MSTRIAVLAAMPSELHPLVQPLSLKRAELSGGEFMQGKLVGIEIVAVTTGIGTAAAERRAQAVLDTFPVDHLVVVGIAGGLGPGTDVGDLVLPEVVLSISTRAMYRPSALGDARPGGILATFDAPLKDPEELARLERGGVIAMDMETAAIAHVCQARHCPWSVFRGISDRAVDGLVDESLLQLAGPDGRPSLGSVLRFVLANPAQIARLYRLARGASIAARVAAAAAVHALEEVCTL